MERTGFESWFPQSPSLGSQTFFLPEPQFPHLRREALVCPPAFGRMQMISCAAMWQSGIATFRSRGHHLWKPNFSDPEANLEQYLHPEQLILEGKQWETARPSVNRKRAY